MGTEIIPLQIANRSAFVGFHRTWRFLSEFASEWKAKAGKVRPEQRDWRWLEFVIASTEAYDKTVGGKVDVLQMFPSGQVRWLQNTTCPKLPRTKKFTTKSLPRN
jgi:hypothetical protein